jgi:hypothetical protein
MYKSPQDLPVSTSGLISLLASASYFGDIKLVEIVVKSLVSKIALENINDIISLFSLSHEFLYPGIEKIQETIFSLLCREFYSLSMADRKELYMGIDSEFMSKVISSDCFYVPNEISRYRLLEEMIQSKIVAKETTQIPPQSTIPTGDLLSSKQDIQEQYEYVDETDVSDVESTTHFFLKVKISN